MIKPLLRIDEKLGKLTWPIMETVAQPAIAQRATFIVACGFEERAEAYLERAATHGQGDFKVVAIEYLPHHDANRKSDLEVLCRSKNIDLTWVVYDRCNPEGIGEELLGFFEQDRQLLIDISGMSRLLIVQVLVALGRRPEGFMRAQIIYTEANEYPPTLEEFMSDCEKFNPSNGDPEPAFISWGVQALAVLPELTSPSMQGMGTRLITFPSFNRAQLRQTVDELQPSHVSLIHGIPPYDELHWRREAIIKLNGGIIETLPGLTDHLASTLDYRETLQVLINIYANYSAFEKLVIAPTGSKMQSVAVGIAVAFIPDLQVVYPTPKVFSDPQRHTLGVKQSYSLPLDGFSCIEMPHKSRLMGQVCR